MKTSVQLVVLSALLCGIFSVSNGQLTSASVSEGSCSGNTPPAPPQHSLLTWAQIFAYGGTWYYPMASQFWYRKRAETLLGRPAANEAELEQINLSGSCLLLGCTFSGYSAHFTQLCTPYSILPLNLFGVINTLSCPVISGSSGTNIAGFGSEYVAVVWADDNTLLLSECATGSKTFVVFSKTRELEQSTIDIISSQLISAGYSASHFQFITNSE